MPDFKTIADFRKDNGKVIRRACRQFVVLCQKLGLFSETMIAIDGSKFKAVNNRDRNFTSAKLQRRMEEIESSISRYLSELDTADRQEPALAQLRTERLHDKPYRYWSSHCQRYAIKERCTPGEQRRVTRWEHEEVLEAMQARLDHAPDSMRIRRQTVEHPFGTIKLWMGSAHFLTKTLKLVSTEISLHVLVYNLKRVIKILGPEILMAEMRG